MIKYLFTFAYNSYKWTDSDQQLKASYKLAFTTVDLWFSGRRFLILPFRIYLF